MTYCCDFCENFNEFFFIINAIVRELRVTERVTIKSSRRKYRHDVSGGNYGRLYLTPLSPHYSDKLSNFGPVFRRLRGLLEHNRAWQLVVYFSR